MSTFLSSPNGTPQPRRRRRWLAPAVAALAAAVALSVLLPIAAAQRHHRVRSGQTLARIARRYRVTTGSLAGANQMRPTARLRVGQVLTIPEDGVVYVAVGQTLSEIAAENHVPMAQLARTNRISVNETLRVGQRLVLPGHENAARARNRYGRPRHPGVVSFYRVATQENLRIRLFDNRGRARSGAQRRLSQLMRDRQSDATHQVDTRLMRLLVLVSDHFGGRKISVISGFREAGGFTRESSRHTQGKAIDLRIRGVGHEELRDYCRTLGNVGVGYYPNSSFVHLDTRREAAYWVDYSGPGEAPRYRRRSRQSSGDSDDADASDDSSGADDSGSDE